MADEPRYPIRAVTRLTGIPAPTLRSWERRYGFPSPARSATARRYYSGADLEAIRWLKAQAEHGLSIGQAVEWYRNGRAGEARIAAHLQKNGRSDVPEKGAAAGSTALVRELLEVVEQYDESALESALSSAFGRYPPDEVLLDVMVPVLDEIGERWARGALAIAAEHFASNVFRRRLFNLLGQQPVLDSAPSVVLACVAGEEHELGLLMLAVFLRWTGLHPLYLGASVPPSDLLACLRLTDAPAVCLSAIDAASMPALIEATALIAASGVKAEIFAGGNACAHAPLARGVRVLGDDLREATQIIATAVRTGSPDRVRDAESETILGLPNDSAL